MIRQPNEQKLCFLKSPLYLYLALAYKYLSDKRTCNCPLDANRKPRKPIQQRHYISGIAFARR